MAEKHRGVRVSVIGQVCFIASERKAAGFASGRVTMRVWAQTLGNYVLRVISTFLQLLLIKDLGEHSNM